MNTPITPAAATGKPRVLPPTRSFDNQEQNFHGSRGSNDQEKVLAEGTPRNAQVEDALFGDTDTWETFEREKPIHRVMIEMSAAGYSNQEIADFTRYNVHHVGKILRQPFARERLVQTIKKSVRAEMTEFLEGEVLPSLRVLKSVRDNGATKNSDKIVASNSLLDRFLGKPVQPISEDAKAPSEMSDEELRKQIERELTTSQPN